MVASNCPKFCVPTLNGEIINNKNIHHYCKRWFDLHNIVLKATSAVVEIANLCLEADNKNEVIHSKDVVVKVIDAITLLGKANHQMTFGIKERLKNGLPEDYKIICEQDHSDYKQLLGDDLADNVKKAKATQFISMEASSPRNPTSLYSSNLKASTITSHSLNLGFGTTHSLNKAARKTSSARSPPSG